MIPKTRKGNKHFNLGLFRIPNSCHSERSEESSCDGRFFVAESILSGAEELLRMTWDLFGKGLLYNPRKALTASPVSSDHENTRHWESSHPPAIAAQLLILVLVSSDTGFGQPVGRRFLVYKNSGTGIGGKQTSEGNITEP
jgi:hypothetical protein